MVKYLGFHNISATINITTMWGDRDDTGFTIVEILVSMVLAMLFLVFFVRMFQAVAAQQVSVVRQSHANDIAFSNLSKFPTSSSIDDIGASYTCDTSTSATANTNNLTINPDANGTVILDDSSDYRETDLQQLPNASQEIRAYSPLGCGSGGELVKLVSTVTYGFTGQQGKAVYATYVQN